MFITLQITILLSLFFLLLGVRYIQKSNSDLTDEFGLGRGIVALLGQSIGLVTFLASSQASYEYGVIGLLGYCLAGIASFLFIYLLLKRNDGMLGRKKEMLEAFKWLCQLENIIIFILAGKMIIKLFYGLNIIIAACMLVIFYQFIILARNKNQYPGSLMLVILSLVTTVLIPTLVYLKVSVPTVYSGVDFLATDMLILDEPSSWLIVVILCVRFSAHNLLNEQIWSIYSKIKQTKRALSFTLTPLIWMFLPLSIGTLSFVAKASAVWPALNDEVSFNVVQQFGGQFGGALLVVTLIVIMFSSISTYVIHQESGQFSAAIKVGTEIIAVLIAAFIPDLTILDVMFYFSFIWAAMVPIFSIKKIPVPPFIVWIAVSACAAAGIYFMIQQGLMAGIIIELFLSSFVTVIFVAVTGIKHRQ